MLVEWSLGKSWILISPMPSTFPLLSVRRDRAGKNSQAFISCPFCGGGREVGFRKKVQGVTWAQVFDECSNDTVAQRLLSSLVLIQHFAIHCIFFAWMFFNRRISTRLRWTFDLPFSLDHVGNFCPLQLNYSQYNLKPLCEKVVITIWQWPKKAKPNTGLKAGKTWRNSSVWEFVF